MRTVAAYAIPEDAYLAKARLEGSGVAATIRDDVTSSVYWMNANAIGGLKVDVADEDYARALEVLEIPAAAPGIPQCPFCGSTNVRLRKLKPWAAIRLGLGLDSSPASRKAGCLACGRSFAVDSRPRSR